MMAKPVRKSIRKTATCVCGERLIWRPKSDRFTKKARRRPWFHANTLKEDCMTPGGIQWLEPLKPIVVDEIPPFPRRTYA